MRVINKDKEKQMVTLNLFALELAWISNCMNEVLNGFDFDQVYIRIGGDIDRVHKVHEQLVDLLRYISPVSPSED